VNTNENFRPFANISVLPKEGGQMQFEFKSALLDTGSPFTIFPEEKLEEYEFVPTGKKQLGIAGEILKLRQYRLKASLTASSPFYLLTALGWERSYALIGTDLMKFYRIEINFPFQKVNIYKK
jgi:hypothetical protein